MKLRLRYQPARAVAHLRAVDPLLSGVIDRVGPYRMRPSPVESLFEALLRSIVYQQLNGKAAGTIHGRVVALLAPHGGPTPSALAAVTDEGLRAAGLSRAKLAAARDLAAKCAAGVVPTLAESHELSDEELVARLTEVRGIGPWTVHMLLLFTLGRPDVMPTGDFAIRLAWQRLHGRRRSPKPDYLLRQTRHWAPYRSVASWYLWRSLELPVRDPGMSPIK